MRFEEFKKLKRLEKFAEGYRGVIYTYTEDGRRYAVKVPSEEKLIKTFQKEAKILDFLNRKGVNFVPRLTFVGEDFFVYRFIEGIPFKKIQRELDENQKRYYLRKILLSAYILDCLGVFKDEFQRPFTNVLVNGKKVFLLDFERGLLNKKWKNVPQYLQFLTAVGVLDRETAISLGREYKKNPKGVVKRIISLLR
jgi:putative serine/threonine protein kinase